MKGTKTILTENQIKEICIMYKDNTLKKCAEKYKISVKTFKKILKENSIKIRTISETKGITEEIITKIEELYKQGLSILECEKILGVGHTTIRNVLIKKGIIRTISESFGITKEFEQKIIKDYLSGISQIKLKEIYKIERVTIRNILKRNNTPLRAQLDRYRKYNFDKNYFKKIDSKDKAYFLGWMVSDGNNNVKSVRLQIAIDDVEILHSFKKYIKYEGNIAYGKKINPKHKIIVSLDISSVELSRDLSKLGVIPAKTHHTYFPDIPEEFYSHFIRGVFDGDGSMSISKKEAGSFTIMGNITLIAKIQDILIEKCKISKTKLYTDKRMASNIVEIRTGKNIDIINIKEYLYKDCEDLYLKRKKEKFEKFQSIKIYKK